MGDTSLSPEAAAILRELKDALQVLVADEDALTPEEIRALQEGMAKEHGYEQ